MKVRVEMAEAGNVQRLARIDLAVPERCNSLDPEILGDLADALDAAEKAGAGIVRLGAEGRHFSTGGDLVRFIAACDAGDVVAYSDRVVGALQAVILRLVAMPAVVVTGARGAITGGSAGLVFASDVVILADTAFIQPYFSQVGFSPDGGWTALLPELIGPGQALALQQANARLSAGDAQDLGLAVSVVPDAELEATHDDMVATLAAGSVEAMVATKRLIWDEARVAALEARLAAEKASFCRLIATEEAQEGMRRFVEEMGGNGN